MMGKQFTYKVCKSCGLDMVMTGPAQKYCNICAVTKAKESRQKAYETHRLRNGKSFGVGVGNYVHKSGVEASAYKTGIKFFMATGKRMKKDVRYCERCQKDLLNVGPAEWCTHHRDHDRTNNTRENFELLCKRCHQLEHDCYDALKPFNEERAA